MKTLEQFRGYFESNLTPILTELEGQRKKVLQSYGWLALVLLGISVIALLILAVNPMLGPAVIIIPLVIAIIVGAIIGPYLSRDYARRFKTEVLTQIVRFFDPSLEFRPDSTIEQSTYMESKLFPHKPDRFKGEDLVEGKIGATAVRFCEIHTEYKTTRRDNKGHTHTEWHTIFRGLFFQADFNKHFAGSTVVLPDSAEALFGKFGQWLQSFSFGRDQLIKLDDPEFEKLFVVYGTDQIESRYILSPALMQRIVECKAKRNRPIHLSFVGSCVFVAISENRCLFEPKIFSSILDFNTICEYFNDLRLAAEIVEDLNLNTRIWTKQ
ncbi:MAG: DUF3137 domain-containing protein [Phycisphaerae bacterium]|nr:DUF3137 domain-containing protein [Phycisphaerae bacterium]